MAGKVLEFSVFHVLSEMRPNGVKADIFPWYIIRWRGLTAYREQAVEGLENTAVKTTGVRS